MLPDIAEEIPPGMAIERCSMFCVGEELEKDDVNNCFLIRLREVIEKLSSCFR